MPLTSLTIAFQAGLVPTFTPTPVASATSSVTATPAASATATVGGQVPHAASFDATSGVAFLVYTLIILAGIVVLTPLFLQRRDINLFRTPYITWYLLHYSIAGLGIIAVAVLALTGVV